MTCQPSLGGTQAVDQHAAAAEPLLEYFGVAAAGEIALEPDHPEAREVDVGGRERAEDRRHAMKHRDPLGLDPAGETLDAFGRQVDQMAACPVEQRSEQAGDGTAVGAGLQQGEPILAADHQAVGVAQDVVQHVAMAIGHALGPAGRARGVVDVGQPVGCEIEPGILARRPLVDGGQIQQPVIRQEVARRRRLARPAQQQRGRAIGQRVAIAEG